MSTGCLGLGAMPKPPRLWQGLEVSLDLVEAVVGVRDSVGRVQCRAVLSVPLVLSLRAFLSPHGVRVAPHHSPEDHGAARRQRGWGQPGARL